VRRADAAGGLVPRLPLMRQHQRLQLRAGPGPKDGPAETPASFSLARYQWQTRPMT
jgi:hypothetical protein